jgi:hypothetical protein
MTEKHEKTNLEARSPNDVKALEMALHLNSGYHELSESSNASYSYLKRKHDEAHK